jgi:hypothetical protein
MRKNFRYRIYGEEAAHGPGNYVLHPAEFPAKSEMGSFSRARQGDRVSARAVEKDRLSGRSIVSPLMRTLRKLGGALQRFGMSLIGDWYEATRFTPSIGRLFQ